MNLKKWFFLLLIPIALAPIMYFTYNVKKSESVASYPMVQWLSPGPKAMTIGEELKVGSIQILDGHVFFALLEDNEWHEIRLTHATTDEATSQVVDLLKSASSQPPTVILRRKLGSVWYVDFNLTVGNKRVTLLDWLADKKLTL